MGSLTSLMKQILRLWCSSRNLWDQGLRTHPCSLKALARKEIRLKQKWHCLKTQIRQARVKMTPPSVPVQWVWLHLLKEKREKSRSSLSKVPVKTGGIYRRVAFLFVDVLTLL